MFICKKTGELIHFHPICQNERIKLKPMNKNGKMTYDWNGNLTKVLNKNITEIKYNCLYLLTEISSYHM